MDTRRSEWEEDKELKAEQGRSMSLKKYNKLLTSGRCSNKDPKDAQTLDLVGVDQNIVDDSKKSSEKSNKDPTKGETAYIRDLPPYIPEDPKWGVKKNKDAKEYWWCK